MNKQPIQQLESDAILKCLRKNLNEQRPITLYNIYHGIPITYEADVAMVHPDYVGMVVHPYQTVCIREDRCTYIESKFIQKMVCACPVSIDYTNHVVLLNQLRVPEDIPENLFHSWVIPNESLKADIGSDHTEDFSAKIEKIAMLNDNRVRITAEVPVQVSFAPHEAVELTFRLEKGGDLLQVQGVARSLMAVEGLENRQRLEMEGWATMGDEISILAYIAKREDEIMGKLDKAYRKLRKG